MDLCSPVSLAQAGLLPPALPPDWRPPTLLPRRPTELSCSKNEKELEELLLEASQESGQETL